MKLIRIILFPFSVLYWFITSIRNFFYDIGFFKSYSFAIPVIAVGNLSVGGTGKTPQIEYLIRLLSSNYKVATLSRGYKRKSRGFILANAKSNADVLGDEPFQFYKKFIEIQVAVDANRKNGIEQLLLQKSKPELILLDDAYQHRRVKADFYILLTSYNDLFADDFLLPTGNLRESRSGANRATSVVVTKCPKNLSEMEQSLIENKLNLLGHQKIFFTFIEYDDTIYSKAESLKVSEIINQEKLVLAGIAKPQPFFDFIATPNSICMKFQDHHDFSEKDIDEIKLRANGKLIITTEKDYVRLQDKLPLNKLYYLPIKSAFVLNQESFDLQILNFIKQFEPLANSQ